MSAAFFGLAFVAALNAKLFGVDVLLMENRRARLMFVCFLLGALGLSLTLGLLDVLVFDAQGIRTQDSISATVDLVLGVALLTVGTLVATGRLRRDKARAGEAEPEQKEGWAQRMLGEPRFGLAVLIGALCGLPSAPYVSALGDLTTGHSATATQIVAVVLFNLIMFSVVLIALGFLELRPEATKRRLRHVNEWLTSHARQLFATVALAVGAYMAISGLARVLS
jgi:hypothetical protein